MYTQDIIKDLKKIKTEKSLSNQDIADATGVPLGTVARVFGNQPTNFKYETIQPIIVFLVGSDIYSEQPTKSLPDDEMISFYKNVIKELRQSLDSEKTKHNEDVITLKAETKEQIAEMKSEHSKSIHHYEKAVTFYRVSCAFFVIISILLIILDYTLPNVGWIFR